MKKYFTVVLVFIARVCAGQNLVPNPSFEDTVSCPTFASQIDRALGWHASNFTPDYFNECDWLNGNTSVPANFRGYQYAQSGVAYVGIGTYASNYSNFTEAFTCQLIAPLTIGTRYLVSFYVSQGDLFYRLSCNKLGALFSTINYTIGNPTPMNNYCQFYTDSIINDTTNWVLVQGSFIADSNYTFLSIGRFFDDFNTDTICSPPFYPNTYYFVDNLTVMIDTTTSNSELRTNTDVTIYPNPVKEKFKIYIKNSSVSGIEIYNAKGEQLLKYANANNQKYYEINLQELKQGVYFLKINYIQKNSTYHKLLKQ